MTEQAIRIKRQQDDLKTVQRLMAIQRKQKFDECMKYWDNKSQLKDIQEKS